MKLLIVGANGLLGRKVTAYFSGNGVPVIKASHLDTADIHLDLRTPPTQAFIQSVPLDTTHAMICSSITSIDYCFEHAEESFAFNVLNTITLLQMLFERGIMSIFCSSDLVFKGDNGNYAENDLREPTTEYGRQKKVVEDFILKQDAPHLIIRMSKLYSTDSDDTSPIRQIITSLQSGQAIRAATDQKICPTCVDDIPRVIHNLTSNNLYGVYHVTSEQCYTRYDLALLLASKLQKTDLVHPCSICEFKFKQARPINNSLEISKVRSALGFHFCSLEEMLPALFANLPLAAWCSI